MTKRYYLLKKEEIYEFIDSEEAYFRTSSLEELLSISEDTLNQQDERIQELKKVKEQVFNLIDKKLEENEKELNGVDTAMYYAVKETLIELKNELKE